MSTISQYVQGSAEIVTILTLRENDVYKRLQKKTYGEDYELKYGVVTSVNANGAETMIMALEFDALTGGVPELKVYGSQNALMLFAVTVDELVAGFAQLKERADREVQRAQEELMRKVEIQAQIQRLLKTHTDKKLTQAPTVNGQVVPVAIDGQ